MQSYLIEMLVCPMCHGELQWQVSERRGVRIETAQSHCAQCGSVYPVREGLGLLLTPDLPREDLWQEVDGQLLSYLHEHPRALVLEELGDYGRAKTLEDEAKRGIYVGGGD